jgi:hypothetical protein
MSYFAGGQNGIDPRWTISATYFLSRSALGRNETPPRRRESRPMLEYPTTCRDGIN